MKNKKDYDADDMPMKKGKKKSKKDKKADIAHEGKKKYWESKNFKFE